MYNIGVIGDKDSIMIFKLLGIEIFPCVTAEEAKKTVDKLVFKKYAIIFITEDLAQQIEDVIEKYKKEYIPSIVLIPSSRGSLGIGLNKISDNVEKAIGVNIL